MADIRLTTIDRLGTEPKRTLTFQIDNSDITFDATLPGGSSVVGRAVMLSANNVVRLAGAASPVLGKLIQVHADGACAVQTMGTVDLPKGDGACTAGSKVVGDVRTAARGYVRSVAAATLAEVAVANHHVIDASDAEAVELTLAN